jgi:hypothetical protein
MLARPTCPRSMPLCLTSTFRSGLGRGRLPGAVKVGCVVMLVSGPGNDLSEVPVCQGVSRPRWSESRPWVSSPTR